MHPSPKQHCARAPARAPSFLHKVLNRVDTFPCTQCGLCCQHVNLAPETQFLDRGDGTCRHYDAPSKGCSIYSERPAICRVDQQFHIRYSRYYSWDEYVRLNLEVCGVLQAKAQTIPVLALP